MDFGETPNAGSLFRCGQESLQDSDLPKKCSRPLLHGICFFLLILAAGNARPTPQLASDLALSREGYFVLSWVGTASGELLLQQADDAAFSTGVEAWQVTGATQFTQSGLVNGDYYFRLRDEAGFSNAVHVRVEHHSLARAGVFFALGALLFGALVTSLMLGQRRLRSGDSA